MDFIFFDRNTAVYFDSFGTEYIPQEVLSKIKDKSITYNIFRIQSDDSIMCGFYCETKIQIFKDSRNRQISEMISYELRIASCYFEKINLQVVSYFLRVAVLKE